MAKYKAPQPAKQINLVGMDDVSATYTDIFLVITEEKTQMSEIYFFQSQIPVPTEAGTIRMGTRTKAKCVGRIVLNPVAMDKLFEALRENRAASKSQTEEKKSEAEEQS